jgi:thiamine pyrophosphate-dependent acetolactate synthase large subunit-like protein
MIEVEPGSDDDLQAVAVALARAKNVVVLAGAGISTDAGIPVCSGTAFLAQGLD